MCRFISFFHKQDEDGKPEIAIWDLNSHGETEQHLKLNLNIWQEGHYLPDGKIELRYNDNFKYDKKEYEEVFKLRFPTFKSFLQWCLDRYETGTLYLSNYDLKGIIDFEYIIKQMKIKQYLYILFSEQFGFLGEILKKKQNIDLKFLETE